MSDNAWLQQLTDSGDNFVQVDHGPHAQRRQAVLNRRLYRGQIHPDGLNEQLCLRFGFCGEEYDSILNELAENGRKKLFF